jgi:transposase
MKQDVISLTQKQLNTLDVINKAIAGFVTVAEAASALGLSERQVQRLKKKVRESGPVAVVHKNSLRASHNAIPKEVKDEIISLKKSDVFESANFCHFRELLSEHHDIDIGYATLHAILTEANIESPKKRRRFKPHRRRKRRPQAGLLLQTDASLFPWFKGDRKQYSLHGGIDDATSQVTALYMCKNECLHGYFEMLRRTIHNYGIPLSLYADRHTIFQSPNKEKAVIDSSLTVNDTQLGRCLRELDIALIPARSPQAKGRIERLWETLQSRLPVEFALREISTIDDANEFLASYIYAFNSEFAVEPSLADSMFHKPSEGINIDYSLCIREERTVDAGGVFSFHNRSFKVEESTYSGMIPPHARCQILSSPEFGVKLLYRGIVFNVLNYVPPKRKPAPEKEPSVPHSIADDHPFKYGQSLAVNQIYGETDSDIFSMLEDIFLRKMA